MVKFWNERFGLPFWVAEDRVEEYKGAGYKLAPDSSKEVKPKEVKEEAKEKATEPKTTKKTAKK